jgi:hypothetical protein
MDDDSDDETYTSDDSDDTDDESTVDSDDLPIVSGDDDLNKLFSVSPPPPRPAHGDGEQEEAHPPKNLSKSRKPNTDTEYVGARHHIFKAMKRDRLMRSDNWAKWIVSAKRRNEKNEFRDAWYAKMAEELIREKIPTGEPSDALKARGVVEGVWNGDTVGKYALQSGSHRKAVEAAYIDYFGVHIGPETPLKSIPDAPHRKYDADKKKAMLVHEARREARLERAVPSPGGSLLSPPAPSPNVPMSATEHAPPPAVAAGSKRSAVDGATVPPGKRAAIPPPPPVPSRATIIERIRADIAAIVERRFAASKVIPVANQEASLKLVAEELNAAGWKDLAGLPWAGNTVRAIIDPKYLAKPSSPPASSSAAAAAAAGMISVDEADAEIERNPEAHALPKEMPPPPPPAKAAAAAALTQRFVQCFNHQQAKYIEEINALQPAERHVFAAEKLRDALHDVFGVSGAAVVSKGDEVEIVFPGPRGESFLPARTECVVVHAVGKMAPQMPGAKRRLLQASHVYVVIEVTTASERSPCKQPLELNSTAVKLRHVPYMAVTLPPPAAVVSARESRERLVVPLCAPNFSHLFMFGVASFAAARFPTAVGPYLQKLAPVPPVVWYEHRARSHETFVCLVEAVQAMIDTPLPVVPFERYLQ